MVAATRPNAKSQPKVFDGERDTDLGLGMYPWSFVIGTPTSLQPRIAADLLIDKSDADLVRNVHARKRCCGDAHSYSMQCILADIIACATNLRVEDAAFASNKCGLLKKRKGEIWDGAHKSINGEGGEGQEGEGDVYGSGACTYCLSLNSLYTLPFVVVVVLRISFIFSQLSTPILRHLTR